MYLSDYDRSTCGAADILTNFWGDLVSISVGDRKIAACYYLSSGTACQRVANIQRETCFANLTMERVTRLVCDPSLKLKRG